MYLLKSKIEKYGLIVSDPHYKKIDANQMYLS